MPKAHSPRLLLPLVLVLLSLTADAQRLEFRQLGVGDGLPSSEVYNLVEDAKGYIWAFTEYGLAKHNGTRFIPAARNLPFEESIVYSVCQSPRKEMYLGNSKAQLMRISNDSAFFVRGTERVSYEILRKNATIYATAVDDSSNIYFSTFDESYELQHGSNKLIDLSLRYRGDSLGIIYKKIGNSYFFINTCGMVHGRRYLEVLDEHDRVILRQPYNAEMQERYHMLERNGMYYFLFKHELRAVEKNGNSISVPIVKSAITMKIAPNGHVWVGTQDGVIEYDRKLHALNHYFAGQDISDILFDSQGSLWISSIEKGVYYCKNMYMQFYNNIGGLTDNITMMRQLDGKLFIGTGNGNLYLRENDSLRKVDLNGNQHFITDIIFYNGEYLVGTKNRIITLNTQLKVINEGNRFMHHDNQGWHLVNTYCFDVIHDTLVFVTGSTVIKRYHLDSCQAPLNKPFIFKTRKIVHNSRDCYIGTNKGVFRLGNNLEVPAYLAALNMQSIVRLRVDKDDNTWICTKGAGLYVLRPDHRLIRVSIPTNVALDLNKLDDTTFLLSTNRGLYIATTTDIALKAPWRLLYGHEIFATELYKNDIVMSTADAGLITMSRRALLRKKPAPLYLESFTVYNHKLSPANIHLSHSQNDLYFNFDILKYDEEHLSFLYLLEGPYSDKGKVFGTQLHLQNLEPGYYQLYVYLPGPGNTRESCCFIPFYIEPAFWQTKFFIIEVLVTVVAFCVFFTGFFYDRLKKKQEQKMMITRLIIEQRLTALKAQINPHFISNSLTGIQQLILENKIDKANQYIAKFSLLIRYILNYSDKPAALLATELEIIELNIELERLRFSNRFIYEKRVDPEINTGTIHIPPLITQPLIENAIWHGLLPLADERVPTLILKVEKRDDLLVISIIDNGVGRPKIQPSRQSKRESRGTWLIANRISNLNRLHPHHRSELIITDLVDAEGLPAGTRAELVFPIIVLDSLTYDDKTEDTYY